MHKILEQMELLCTRRPDERHIRYQDVRDLKKIINTEFNIEGNSQEKKFVDTGFGSKTATGNAGA